MKQVVKGPPPESFENWKALASDQWQPTYAGLQNPQKADLHNSLLNEQGWVCCYCGRRISLAHSHIEHFRPQEQYLDLALAPQNLYASCIRETSPGSPLHCGHAKGNRFDEAKAIAPDTIGCERRFRYALDGQIIATDEFATYMQTLLKLDIEFLNDRRAQALLGVFDDDFLATASSTELERICIGYRQPDDMGRLPDFGHAIARYAEQLINTDRQ